MEQADFGYFNKEMIMQLRSTEKKVSIYEHNGDTLVAFGSGSIQMGFSKDSAGQIQVHLSDVMRANPIGLELAEWEDAKGRTVILGFNKADSIDVLIKTLEEARDSMTTRITP